MTVSARTPEVRIQTTALRRCDDCGAWVTDEVVPGEHAAHLVPLAGQQVLVNCVGQRIEAVANG